MKQMIIDNTDNDYVLSLQIGDSKFSSETINFYIKQLTCKLREFQQLKKTEEMDS